ncbi:HAD family hydrolase [Pontivivens insulae]|uniref:phosphoglycolate phosphatase n=1 Tax=Pontivivens insulae TaxID=1639689 RepID=A0A2R8AG69_9RHOB|nr:HAD family hydrolase [Pontivivens insulae]RED12303.1 phosphoglycolate phosphatase [Pontivivens insulae]SPF31060.1 Phosphoglycolate phosphatase [Pontivivens insulae]
MVKAILFDKDGTLFGFDATWGPWTERILKELSRDEDHLNALAVAAGFNRKTQAFDPTSPVIAGTPEDAARVIAPLLKTYTVATLTEALSRAAETVEPVEAVPLRPLLEQLAQDHKLGVMTNDAERAAHDQLSRCGVTEYFDAIIGFDSGYGAKPDPDPLLAFAAMAGLAPGDIAMIGDSSHDLHAARAAGFVPVGVLTGPATEDDLYAAGAAAVLSDIGALPEYLAAR